MNIDTHPPMPLNHLPSSEKPKTWELPGIRATISNDTELGKWRENLYLSMTCRSSSAISRFLSEGSSVVDMMKTLNKQNIDRTKKSKWATLQAIILYKK